MTAIIDRPGGFRSFTLKPREGRSGRLQSGDAMHFNLASDGTIATYGFIRSSKRLHIADENGKAGDDKFIPGLFVNSSLSGRALVNATSDFAELIGAVCGLPYLIKARDDEQLIIWRFYRSDPQK